MGTGAAFPAAGTIRQTFALKTPLARPLDCPDALGQPRGRALCNHGDKRSSASAPVTSSTSPVTSGIGTGRLPNHLLTHLSLTGGNTEWGEHVIETEYQGN